MDCRLTLKAGEAFLEILTSSYEKANKVYLLLDDNGLVRIEGFVKAIFTDCSSTILELQNGKKIDIKMIVAVNGIFLPEYGEC
jgi:hypothetical protein